MKCLCANAGWKRCAIWSDNYNSFFIYTFITLGQDTERACAETPVSAVV